MLCLKIKDPFELPYLTDKGSVICIQQVVFNNVLDCLINSRYKMNNNSSAVYNHSSSTGHPVSSEDFKIISSTRNSMDLLIHESLLILRDRPNLNSQTSSIQLTLF